MKRTFFDELVEDHKETSASNRRMLRVCIALSFACLLGAMGLFLLNRIFKDEQWIESGWILLLALGGPGFFICGACFLWLCVSVRLRLIFLGISFAIGGLVGIVLLFSDEDGSIFERVFESVFSLIMLVLGLMVVGAWLVHLRRKRDMNR